MGRTTSVLDRSIAEVIAAAKLRTGWTEEQISQNIGYNPQYLKSLKTRGKLRKIPTDKLQILAVMAGREIRIVETKK